MKNIKIHSLGENYIIMDVNIFKEFISFEVMDTVSDGIVTGSHIIIRERDLNEKQIPEKMNSEYERLYKSCKEHWGKSYNDSLETGTGFISLEDDYEKQS